MYTVNYKTKQRQRRKAIERQMICYARQLKTLRRMGFMSQQDVEHATVSMRNEAFSASAMAIPDKAGCHTDDDAWFVCNP